MKKLFAVMLAVCFVLGSLSSASAADVKISGEWLFSYGYYGNWNMHDAEDVAGIQEDRFDARFRSRIQLEVTANENLKGTTQFEIGHTGFGEAGLGEIETANNANFKVRRMFVDWTIPSTGTQIRMGKQQIGLPAGIFNNFVLNSGVAGIAVTQQFNPTVGLTAFWARPYDTTRQSDAAMDDEMDVFGLVLPIKSQWINFSPYFAYAFIGQNAKYWSDWTNSQYQSGAAGIPGLDWNHDGDYADADEYAPIPAVPSYVNATEDGTAWWVGFALDAPVLDPFILKLDAVYGALDAGDSKVDSNATATSGYYVAAQFGYKWNWGTTSLYGWYASGDDDNLTDGERGTAPFINDEGGFATGGGRLFGGSSAMSRGNLLHGVPVGTWGLGFGIEGVKFTDALTHGLKAFYVRGTNAGENIGDAEPIFTSVNTNHRAYMISTDSAYSVELTNAYRVNPNLVINFDLSYATISPSDQRTGAVNDYVGAYAGVMTFAYTF